MKPKNDYFKNVSNLLELTKSCVELLFSQALVIIDIVVLKQVEQRAFERILRQTLLLDNLRINCIQM